MKRSIFTATPISGLLIISCNLPPGHQEKEDAIMDSSLREEAAER